MKLLMFTQILDKEDARLGFVHDWVLEFAKRTDNLIVVCLYKGKVEMPRNVKVLSLGKEKGVCRIKYLFRFYKYIWQERKNYDHVFAHMNAIYVVLGGWFWKMNKKKVALWYVHKAVPLSLRIAEKFTDIIFSASKTGFNLKTEKLKVLGHGIDLEKFKPAEEKKDNNIFKIIYVGRISKIKNQKLLFEALNILVNKKFVQGILLELIGDALGSDDIQYEKDLKIYLEKNNLNNFVDFKGAVSFNDIPKYYRNADLSLNLCPTGGMDKAVLESLASSVPVIVINKVFSEALSDFKDFMILKDKNPEKLSEKILGIKNLDEQERAKIKVKLREKARDFSLESLIKNILNNLK